MKPSLALQKHRAVIRRIVEANRTTNPRVFGSVAAGEDSEGSDLDILVDPTPQTTLFDLGAIQSELSELLGVPAHVMTPGDLPQRIRGAIVAAAVPV
jgi:predicted nucleotidyltransferase